MGVEIERKFLLRDEAILSQAERVLTIRQGYIKKSSSLGVRIRVSDDKGFITIKGSKAEGSIVRAEYEYEIPVQDALELLSISGENVISKKRHHIRHDGMLWEVDVFEGYNEGLVLAEVELPDETADVSIPEWIGEEVTGSPEYYNSYLALHPYTTWDEKK